MYFDWKMNSYCTWMKFSGFCFLISLFSFCAFSLFSFSFLSFSSFSFLSLSAFSAFSFAFRSSSFLISASFGSWPGRANFTGTFVSPLFNLTRRSQTDWKRKCIHHDPSQHIQNSLRTPQHTVRKRALIGNKHIKITYRNLVINVNTVAPLSLV